MQFKEEVKQRITVTQTNTVEVCTITSIVKDGVVKSSETHLKALQVGDDVSDQSDLVQRICAAVWTPEVIQSYKDSVEETQLF